MIRLIPVVSLVLLLSGCTASFQPFSQGGISRDEVQAALKLQGDNINAALKQRDDNILALAQAVNKLTKSDDEKEKTNGGKK